MNKAVCNFVDNNKKLFVELETMLSGIPAISPISGGEGEYKKVHALEEWLRSKGFDDFNYINAPDEKAFKGIRPSLILTIPGKKQDRNFWIMSHVDVVPPGDLKLWNTDPFKVVEKDGRLYGRGVEDNQHGLCASVMAVLALKETGLLPEYTVKLLFVADEEVGSVYGINYIIDKYPDLFSPNDYALVPDSGSPSGDEIEIAEKSMLWLKFKTKGVQCHASMPHLGRNSFVAASELVLKLNTLQCEFMKYQDALFDPPYSTFAPTKKEANIPNVNTIPGDDVFYLDCRILPSINQKEVMDKIESLCREVESKHDVKIAIEKVQDSSSKPTDPNCEVITRLKKAIKDVCSKDAKLIGIGGGTVAAYLRNKGVNAAVWNTIHETCHTPNEYTDIANLASDAKVMAQMMLL